ncbi:Synaptogyrin-3, partial [Fragariocoptes setiger]
MNQPRAYEATMASGDIGGGICANPVAFITKPQVILKFASTFLSIVTYSCISSGWYQGKCLFNNYSGVCRFGTLTLVAFIGSALFLIFEIVFDKISSIKIRRRIVIADVIFSACAALAYIRYQSGVDMSQFLSPDQYPDLTDPQQQYQADPNAVYSNGYDNAYASQQPDYTTYQQQQPTDPGQDYNTQNVRNPFGTASNY